MGRVASEEAIDGLLLGAGVGDRSPAMSTNALNISGCIAARSTAQVPPIDQPTIPQLAGRR